MTFARWLDFLRMWALCTLCGVALAQPNEQLPTLELSHMSHLPRLVSARVVEGLPLEVGPNQVMRLPSDAFATHEGASLYTLGSGSQTWFWFRVVGAGDAHLHDWHLSVGKAFLDRATLHFRGDQGQWQSAAAGDSLPNVVWPLRSLSPQFVLPNAGTGVHDYLLSINGDRPMNLSLKLQRGDAALAETQADYFLHGIFFGGVVLAVFLSLAFAISHRDARYGWYALYMFAAYIAVAAHYGVGARFAWPHSPEWLHHMTLTLAHFAAIAQLQFCRSMFLDPRRQARLALVSGGGMPVAGLIAVVSPGIENVTLMSGLFMLSVCSILVLTVCIVAQALSERRQAAYLWLMAYVPLIAALAFTVVGSMGLARFDWMPTHAVMIGVMFEVPVLLLALYLHGQHAQALAVRQTTLAQLDPLTGYASASQFDSIGVAFSRESMTRNADCVVALVRLLPPSFEDGETLEGRLKRFVRTLNTVCQESDKVVKLADDLFALVMLTTEGKDQMALRISRLVALGLMERGSAKSKAPLVLRVMASAFDPRKLGWNAFRSALMNRMSANDDWGGKSIRFVSAGDPKLHSDAAL